MRALIFWMVIIAAGTYGFNELRFTINNSQFSSQARADMFDESMEH